MCICLCLFACVYVCARRAVCRIMYECYSDWLWDHRIKYPLLVTDLTPGFCPIRCSVFGMSAVCPDCFNLAKHAGSSRDGVGE